MLIYEENGDTYLGGEPQEGTIGMECLRCGHIDIIKVGEETVVIEEEVLYRTVRPLPVKGDGRNQISFYECPVCGKAVECIEEGGEDNGLLRPYMQHSTERQAERSDLSPHNVEE